MLPKVPVQLVKINFVDMTHVSTLDIQLSNKSLYICVKVCIGFLKCGENPIPDPDITQPAL